MLEDLNILLANAGTADMNQRRYGIKTCVEHYDMYDIQEYIEIYTRALELDPDDMQLDACCGLTRLSEKIKML